jgi:hypothetical protein
MELAIPEAEIRELLTSIEHGTIRLAPMEEPQRVYAGVVQYSAANGWRLAVFSDCNEWDYLQWIEAPDSRCVDYEQLRHASGLAQYEPDPLVAWESYGLPGAMKFRCTRCGTAFKHGKDDIFLCGSCREKTA